MSPDALGVAPAFDAPLKALGPRALSQVPGGTPLAPSTVMELPAEGKPGARGPPTCSPPPSSTSFTLGMPRCSDRDATSPKWSEGVRNLSRPDGAS